MRRISLALRQWRLVLLITISIILIASIAGASIAFILPTQIEQRVSVLKYEHKGKFDYVAHVKAAYLYGDIPLETSLEDSETVTNPISPPSNPKYPAEITDWFDMTFTYVLVPDKLVAGISQQVEIKATRQKPGESAEEVVLVPTTNITGDLPVSFSLNATELALSLTTTIQANVYTTIETNTGPIFESFEQSLLIRSRGHFLEVDRNLTGTQRASFGELSYEQNGNFDYSVRLKSSSPFGGITLRPPPAPEPPPLLPSLPSAKTLGPGETIYSNLFDSMDVTFSYALETDWPVIQTTEDVEINAVLENPKVWRKTFVLIPPTRRNGAFTVTFPLTTDNFSYFLGVFNTIAGETGASVPYNLTIEANVHTVAETDFGPIDETFSQNLSTTLGADTMELSEKLESSQPGTIEIGRLSPNRIGFIGLPVKTVRNLSSVVGGVFFILLMSLVLLNVRFKPEKLSSTDKEALRVGKKHRDVMVDVKELPEARAAEMVIKLDSLDELIKAADNLLKPVLHKSEGDKHIYCVIDGLTRYEYISES